MHTNWELHRRAVAALRVVLTHVIPADLNRPTPCAGWDLRTLLEHMAGQDYGFAAAATEAGRGTDTKRAAFAPRPMGPDPAATMNAGLDAVVAAFAAAADLQQPVLLPEFDRRVPVATLVSMHLVDSVVHGWDVAAALDVVPVHAAALDSETIAAALAVAEQVPDGDYRSGLGASFHPAVELSDDADDRSRTLMLLGRDPAWTGLPGGR